MSAGSVLNVGFNVVLQRESEAYDFAPLFANWVSTVLDIKLSSNLSLELQDGNVFGWVHS